MLNVVSSDSGFEREHEVKRSLKTSSKVKVSNDGAPKAQTKKGMTSKSSKEKGERKRPRVYSGEAKEAIAKMAVKEGDRKAAEHYTKKLGHHVHPRTVYKFKHAHMKNGDKETVELQNPVGQDGTDDLNNKKDQEVGGEQDKEVGADEDLEVMRSKAKSKAAGRKAKTKSSKEKGEKKRPWVFSVETKEAMAKMAIKEGDRKAAEYYTKELGHHVHAMNAHRFKKAYMKNRNMNGDKGSVELQCPDGQEETGDNEKDQDKEVGGNLDEEVGGNLDEELGGNPDEEVGCDQDKEAGGDAKLDQVSAHY